ncbi:hypothetical protein A3N67_04015 [Enterobacter hormaechei subsp. steigerwaltii]|nr:hypothetical protein A3N67_04015 [Enterobacter hormaechei subsp. steigerwaltii]
MNCWRKKLPYSEVSLTWSSGCWSLRDLIATKQRQPLFLLNFGHIPQYLTDVVDTVRVAVTYRNVDIGLVMLFKLTPVQPAIGLSINSRRSLAGWL